TEESESGQNQATTEATKEHEGKPRTTTLVMKILVVDVGGTHVKFLATGQTEHREFISGPRLTAARMVAGVKKLTRDWKYDVVSIGYPGPVLHDRPLAEPHNLGRGWVGFNFKTAFGHPVRIMNDA